MKHKFEIILIGISAITDELEKKLSSKCNDALLSSCSGVVSLDFTRKAKTLESAIKSAFRDVREAGYLPMLGSAEYNETILHLRNSILEEEDKRIMRAISDQTKVKDQELMKTLAEAVMGLMNACQVIREAPKGGEPWEVLCDAEDKVQKVLDVYLGNV